MKIFQKPVTVYSRELWWRYKKGADLIGAYVDDTRKMFEIYGEVSLEDNIDEEECIDAVLDKHSDMLKGKRLVMHHVSPMEDRNEYALSFNEKAPDDFFGEFYDRVIKPDYEKYAYVYGSKLEQVYLYWNMEEGYYWYYGSSKKALTKNEIAEWLGEPVKRHTYLEYINLRKQYFEEDQNKSLKETIIQWVNRVDCEKFYEYISNRVKGQNELKKVAASVYMYLKGIANDKPARINTLMAAPSGCGKTETFRALRDYFADEIPELPIYQLDMTSITEEGFKGSDTSAIVEGLVKDETATGIGIVFLDEFDKKLLPSYTGKGVNVNAAVQAQILTLLEGRKMSIRVPNSNVKVTIDTANTMFVGMGAYDMCRKDKEEQPNGLGFGKAVEKEKVSHYEDITLEDMVKIGASNELLGRFSMLINYHELSEEIIDEIIEENVEKISDNLGVELVLTEAKKEEIRECSNSEYGCRMLYNKICEQAMEAYAEVLFSNSGTVRVVLDAKGEFEIEGREEVPA